MFSVSTLTCQPSLIRALRLKSINALKGEVDYIHIEKDILCTYLFYFTGPLLEGCNCTLQCLRKTLVGPIKLRTSLNF